MIQPFGPLGLHVFDEFELRGVQPHGLLQKAGGQQLGGSGRKMGPLHLLGNVMAKAEEFASGADAQGEFLLLQGLVPAMAVTPEPNLAAHELIGLFRSQLFF